MAARRTKVSDKEWAEDFRRRYLEAMAKGLGIKTREEALKYLRSVGVNTSSHDPALIRTK